MFVSLYLKYESQNIKAPKCPSGMKDHFHVTIFSHNESLFLSHCIFCAGIEIVELFVRSYCIFMLNLPKAESETKSM